ncbi:MAG: thiamine diphosphokinase [Thermotaleaceae bacterium]
MKCAIIANGDIRDYLFIKKSLLEYDFLICADGGVRHFYHMGLLPDIVVGDLDSVNEEHLQYIKAYNIPIQKFSPDKDYTDTELAIRYALDLNATDIAIFGAIGTRMDHTLSNIFLLVPLLKRGIQGKLIDEYNEISITHNNIEVEKKIGNNITILPLVSQVKGITLEGFQYPLEEYDMKMGESIGISNRVLSDYGKIIVQEGILLVIISKDASE